MIPVDNKIMARDVLIRGKWEYDSVFLNFSVDGHGEETLKTWC
jgi:hypothetical protein